jgi:hypothetical protein
MATAEEWRDIDEFKGLYQVSDMGRVRSVERRINKRTYPSVIMRQYPHHNGKDIAGMRVHLRNPNRAGQIQRSVAKLVLITFQGQPPKNAKQAVHIDGNPTNNRLDNLKWDVNKAYYLPPNEKARALFNEYAYTLIKSFIRIKHLYEVKFDFQDSDDFMQECAIRIWDVIDLYDEEHCTFKRFVFMKCEWVFNKMYAKHARRREIASILHTDEMPIDHIKELSYEEKFYE